MYFLYPHMGHNQCFCNKDKLKKKKYDKVFICQRNLQIWRYKDQIRKPQENMAWQNSMFSDNAANKGSWLLTVAWQPFLWGGRLSFKIYFLKDLCPGDCNNCSLGRNWCISVNTATSVLQQGPCLKVRWWHWEVYEDTQEGCQGWGNWKIEQDYELCLRWKIISAWLWMMVMVWMMVTV